MSMAAARPLSPLLWLGLPMLLCLVATLVFAVPLRIAGLQVPQPIFPMVMVFAWAIIRPAVLPPFALLVMGLFLDLFWGGAMALWAVSLLIGYGAVLAGRSMLVGQSKPVLFFWYGATTALSMGAAVVLTALEVHMTPNVTALGTQYVVTLLLYPFAYRLIDTFEDADVRFR